MTHGLDEWLFRDVPQPVFAVVTFGLLALAAIAGRTARRARGTHELGSTQEGYVVSAVLGLLALLVGFTFAMAVDRFDNRRSLVAGEANAIASTYLLAQTLTPPYRQEMSGMLVSYVDIRLALGKADGVEQAAPLLAKSEAQQKRIWSTALAATAPLRDDISANFLSSAQEMISTGEMRIVARRAHIPTRVYTILFVYMLISAGILGYAFAGSPQPITNGTLFVLLTLCMILIIDLDQPTSGRILESQTAMELLKDRLQRMPTAAFAASVAE